MDTQPNKLVMERDAALAEVERLKMQVQHEIKVGCEAEEEIERLRADFNTYAGHTAECAGGDGTRCQCGFLDCWMRINEQITTEKLDEMQFGRVLHERPNAAKTVRTMTFEEWATSRPPPRNVTIITPDGDEYEIH